jgi:hypothetical protein
MRRQRRRLEAPIQAAIVEFWDRCVPAKAGILYAVPNGEERRGPTAALLATQGVRAGVSDLTLVLPGRVVFVETKVAADAVRQVRRTDPTAEQRSFGERVEHLGHAYCVVRSLDEFVRLLGDLGVPTRVRPDAATGAQFPPRSPALGVETAPGVRRPPPAPAEQRRRPARPEMPAPAPPPR